MEKRLVTSPSQFIVADCIGAFPRSKKGYTHLLIFEDLFTKWIEAVQLRKKNAESIFNAFRERILYRHGVPQKLITEGGTKFGNSLMSALAREKDFTHVKLPPGHPQTDPVE